MACKSKEEDHLTKSQRRILLNILNAGHGKRSGHTFSYTGKSISSPPPPVIFCLAHFLSSPWNSFVSHTRSNNLYEQLLERNRCEDLDKFLKCKQSKSHNLRTVSCHVTDKIELAKSVSLYILWAKLSLNSQNNGFSFNI